ncbi:MAG: DUF927 domain-containing protein, partial [Candidatus Dormibacteraceae bacterium]
EWVYLHAGGAIGAAGAVPDITVEPSPALARFVLPAPPDGEEEREALRASLQVLDLAPLRLTVPRLAATYRAPLGTLDTSLHLVGKSGSGKSELTALIQSHWGAELDGRHLPANWQSTANYLRALAFVAKDTVLVVDDFKPTGSKFDRQRMHAEADQLFTAVGNGSGRGRADITGAARVPREPRGVIISSGEEVAGSYSTRARQVILEVEAGEVDGLGPEDDPRSRTDHPALNRLQQLAAEGQMAKAMAGFVRWLAPRRDDLERWRRERVQELRRHVRATHSRVPSNVAELAVGLQALADYSLHLGVVDDAGRHALLKRGWKALLEAAGRQDLQHQEMRPELRFLELVASAIAAGRAHVADRDGLAPGGNDQEVAHAWGWRARAVVVGADIEERLEPQGARIGWLDGRDLYLEPTASHRAANEMDPDVGVGVPKETLARRLNEAGLLASTGDGRHLPVQRRLEGSKKRVLHLRSDALEGGGRAEEDAPTPPFGSDGQDSPRTDCPAWTPPTETSRGSPPGRGRPGPGVPTVPTYEREVGTATDSVLNSETDNVPTAPTVPTTGGAHTHRDKKACTGTEELGLDASTREVYISGGDSGVCGEKEERRGSFEFETEAPTRPHKETAGGDSGDTPGRQQLEVDPVLIRSASDLEAAVREVLAAPAVGFDLETIGLDPLQARIRLAQIAIPGRTFVVELGASIDARALQPLLDDARRIVGHNLKFDLRCLMTSGLELPCDIGHRVADTMLASQLLDAGLPGAHAKGRHTLQALTKRVLGVELDKSEQASDWSRELREEQLRYAARDAAVLLPLAEHLDQELAEAGLTRVVEIESRALPAIAWLEDTGVQIDRDRWLRLAERAAARKAEVEACLD